MPGRGERSAPTFDRSKPRELHRFFDDLERLFERNAITDETEKKKDACRYVDFEVERVWKTFPEYANAAVVYTDFKKAVLVHYPDAEGDFVYSAVDLDTLLASRRRTAIKTTDELQAFHLEFITLTTWLIEKDLMGDFEQRKEYVSAFAEPLLGSIKTRLRMLFLNHHPNKPHKVKDVYAAARYILQDEGTLPQSSYPVPAPVVITPVASSSTGYTNNMPIKAETFATVMADFSKTIADALHQSNRPRITGPTGSSTAPRYTNCNFCGGDHFIRECAVVDEYIVAGKVRRNIDGKVVLSTGAFVPREIPGTLLSERVNEWHRRYPNQLSAATLIHTISTEHVKAHTPTPSIPAFQLSTDDRITVLEAELFSLRARKSSFTPTVKTRAQRARDQPFQATIEELSDDSAVPTRAPTPVPDREEIPAITVIPPQEPIVEREPAIVITPLPSAEPEHPYRQAKDAAYAPPTTRNVGGIIKIPVAKPTVATVPAYKTLPPVHEASIAVDVYKRAMDTPIMITQRELLSLSPEVRAQLREVTTTRRIPTNSATIMQASLHTAVSDDDAPYDAVPTFVLNRPDERIPPKGATIVADPIEEYYNSLEPGEAPSMDRLTVAKESTAIRSIHALVDALQKKECTVDPGCQVVAMSETACHSLGLAYDPRIRLNMESANGSFDWSLGLARNIPFLIGTITLYLQVHVIRSPSYEILLGRPFDVLTESVIRNYNNEDQTITITDPNTGDQCTIPTFARGTRRAPVKEQADF
jgi:hypothetical protein